MKPYGFDGPFDRRKSGGLPRNWKKLTGKKQPSNPSNPQTDSIKSMYRWFKRIARRFGKQQIEEQQE